MVQTIKFPSGELLPPSATPYIFLCRGKGTISAKIVKYSDKGDLQPSEIPSHIAIGAYGLNEYNGEFMVGEARFPEGAKLKTFEAFLERNYDSEITAYPFPSIDFGYTELLCSMNLSYSLQDIRKNLIALWKDDFGKDDSAVICSGLAALSERDKQIRYWVAKLHKREGIKMPANLIQPAHFKRLVISSNISGVKVQ